MAHATLTRPLSPDWAEAPERGNIFWLRVMIGITRALGWHAGHVLLFPITAYFMAFSPRQRAAGRQYLTRVLDRPARLADLFRLYFNFAATILDRVWLASGNTRDFRISVHGLDALRARIDAGQGCLLFAGPRRAGRGSGGGVWSATDGSVARWRVRCGGADSGVLEGAGVIQLTPQMRILVAVEPQDFRRGIDGMAKVCKASLASDPFSGTAYVFRNRRGTSIKILVYDGQGFWLCQKRLSSGKFAHWPSSERAATALEAHELSVLLFGGDWAASRGAPLWRPVTPPD